jgi:hypothetical protein
VTIYLVVWAQCDGGNVPNAWAFSTPEGAAKRAHELVRSFGHEAEQEPHEIVSALRSGLFVVVCSGLQNRVEVWARKLDDAGTGP